MTAAEITQLTPEQRLELIDQLWQSLTPADIPISEEQEAELQRRLDSLKDDLESGRPAGVPWAELSEKLVRRAKGRIVD